MKEKLFAIASTVRTPLTLGGLIVIVFYFLYEKVLSLNIFSQMDASGTRAVVELVLNRVFVLALVITVLGIVSYLITYFFKPATRRLESDVHLIDATLTQGKTESDRGHDDHR
jgi:hypothetical protein